MKRITIFILLAVLLVGCVAEADSSSTAQVQDFGRSSVYRTLDEEAGVVCWTYAGGTGVAISCLPVSETRLGQ